MIAPGNHCIERFAALCNTLPYVPLPALPFLSVRTLHGKNRNIFAMLRM